MLKIYRALAWIRVVCLIIELSEAGFGGRSGDYMFASRRKIHHKGTEVVHRKVTCARGRIGRTLKRKGDWRATHVSPLRKGI